MDIHFTMTDCALVEKASRYGSVLNSWGLRVSGSSPFNSFSFGRTLEGKYYDHSGVLKEDIQERKLLSILVADGLAENGNGCWDLVEVNCVGYLARNLEWGSAQSESQEVRGEKEINWEESSLAKFNHFLDFSTEGLEKEILSFLVKIRKRREMIHSKGLLEKSEFEKELKRLECSINYEGEFKKKCPLQGKGSQLADVQ